MAIRLTKGKFLSPNQRLLLQVICAHTKSIRPMVLQKCVFILQGSSLPSSYEFKRWHYGPFCHELLEDLNFLIGAGLVKESTTFWGQHKIIKANKKSFSDLEYLSQSLLNKIQTNEKQVSKLGIAKYLEKIYLDYKIESYETGAVIFPHQDSCQR